MLVVRCRVGRDTQHLRRISIVHTNYRHLQTILLRIERKYLPSHQSHNSHLCHCQGPRTFFFFLRFDRGCTFLFKPIPCYVTTIASYRQLLTLYLSYPSRKLLYYLSGGHNDQYQVFSSENIKKTHTNHKEHMQRQKKKNCLA